MIKFEKYCDIIEEKRRIFNIGTGGSGMNNLRGTESSPNKKIQRTILSFFENSQGQEEMYTSKTCPCCKQISLKPKICIHGTKCKKNQEIKENHIQNTDFYVVRQLSWPRPPKAAYKD